MAHHGMLLACMPASLLEGRFLGRQPMTPRTRPTALFRRWLAAIRARHLPLPPLLLRLAHASVASDAALRDERPVGLAAC